MAHISNQTDRISDFLSLEVALSHSEKAGSENPKEAVTLRSILLVDDDSDMREYIKDCLIEQYQNMHVMEAENGQSALQILFNVKPDILITDLNMPVMNGLEMIAQITQSIPGWSVPVLIISGSDQHPSDNNNVQALTKWGILKKPFSEEMLVNAIKKLFTH